MLNKFEALKQYLTTLNEQGICLAFSGGIDSSLLLYLCKDLNIEAITFKSIFQTEEEISFTRKFCENYSIKHSIIDFYPLENSVLINNPKDRCYHCKKMMFEKLSETAGNRNIIDGTNYDDLHTYRPGLQALKELEIISPFAKYEITKQEIRDYAKSAGIEIYNKPSTPCLATRFPYGTKLTKEKFDIVYKGEKFLVQHGFVNCRLRLHGDLCRIEIPQKNFSDLLNKRELILTYLKKLGIKYITLDIEGLRSGSMD